MKMNWERLWIDAKKGSVLYEKYRRDVGTDRWSIGAKDYR